MKIILAIFTVFLVIVIGLFNSAKERPKLYVPYPYEVKTQDRIPDSFAEKIQILVVGDHMAQSLLPYLPSLQKVLSQGLNKPVQITYLRGPKDNLSRTLNKLKKFSKLPPLILYLGGSSELYEQKFHIKDIPLIRQNLRLFERPLVASLIKMVPQTSQFIYRSPSERIVLKNEISVDTFDYSDMQWQQKVALTLKFYEHELKELINYIHENNSELMMITSPINLEAAPQKVCHNAILPELESYLNKVGALIEDSRYKEALKSLEQIKDQYIGHSEAYFYHGKLMLHFGRYQEAKISFQLAKAFDCGRSASQPAFNQIIRQFAERYGVAMVDFDQLIQSDLGKNTLFFDQVYPQHFYYQQALAILAKRLKKLFKL